MSGLLTSDLLRLLDSYQPTDPAERNHADRVRAFVARTPDPFTRANLEGQVTASAFVIDGEGRRTLLTHHAKLGRWLQFGGHVEPEDTGMAAAALREAVEESGIADLRLAEAGIFDIDVHPIPANPAKGEGAHSHFDIRFLVRAGADAFVVSDESHDLRWCKHDEAVDLLDYDAGLRRMLAKWKAQPAA